MRWRWQGVAAALAMALVLHPASAAAHPRIEPATANVVGGTDALGSSIGMVAEIQFEDGGELALCSGTVVASNMILTAGHCAVDTTTGVADNASTYVVLTGTQSNSLQQQGQVSGVSQVIVDPNFNTSTLAGDAALLVLSTPTTVTPVALNTDPDLYDAGTDATIAGWGADDSAGDLPTDLQYGSDVVQSASVCAQAAQAGDAVFNPQTQLCAVDAPSYADGACHGDSGGPILATVTGSWVEIGLTSFGPDTCETESPAFYTRTDSIDQWVQSEIADHPPDTTTPVTDTPPATSSPTTPPATTTPASPTTPATTTPTTGPRAGLYSGRTSQGNPITLSVGSAGTVVDHAAFRFTLTCRRHRHLSARLAADVAWPLVTSTGMGFFDTYATHRGAMRFTVSGTFSTAGHASGTLRVTDHAGRRGVCVSGAVRWHAGT